MGWFQEQIHSRIQSDQEILEDSLLQMASVVLDRWSQELILDQTVNTREALDDILKYYHKKPVEIPQDITDPVAQIEAVIRPTGIMIRDVELDEGWQRNATGAMLAFLRDSETAVALIPNVIGGYTFRDPSTGKKERVTRSNASMFARTAICFYLPLPMKQLGIKDLLLYMKRSVTNGDILLFVAATLALTLVGMLEPRIYSLVTGTVLKNRQINLLGGMAVFLICSAFASQMITAVKDLLMNKISVKTTLAVESSVMMRILFLPVSFFRKYSSGELSSRANSVKSLCSMILNNIFSLGLSSLMSLLYVTQIFRYAPELVVPSLLIILATVVVSVLASILQINISRKKMQNQAKESGMSYAMLNGVQKIRLSGSEKRAFARWGRLYSKSAQLEYNPPTFLKLNPVIVTAISLIGTIVLYYMALKSGVSNNDYYAFNAAYARVMGAFTSLAGIAISIAAIPPVLEMAEPILKAEPEVTEEKTIVSEITGNVEMSHIFFRYEKESPYVIEDLSLKIKAGEYVAIVGKTGCGKSTLVRLLLGFETPEKGAVYYDRSDLNNIDPRSLRKKIGVVIQNGQLFQGDIFSNITISAPQLTLDEAWEAAEIAGIAKDIREMPMGMQTVISEGQGGISGGQKQRLMIARAVASKPKLLILDEATSALDNKTQKQVAESLDKLNCTRIVIAHRLSTIRNCDRILVMENGKIIEEGNYQELIDRKGAFAELVARQRLDLGDDSKE